MERITISIEPELATILDELTQRHGYASRSEAMRDLIRGWHSQDTVQKNETVHCVAYMGYVYNHHDRTVAERLSHIQHDQHDLTISSMHMHLDHDHCLEVAFLKGRTREVRQFAHKVMAQTGVRHGQVQILPMHRSDADAGHDHGDGVHHVHMQPTS
jgi:CopG family nickel-responsive transcriptional regulator